jgi:DNA polymerase IIIc chi subunit
LPANSPKKPGAWAIACTCTAATAQRDDLDERLWRFKGESLCPTATQKSRNPMASRHGRTDVAISHQDLLINLDLKVPEFFKRFARVAEVVVEDPAVRLAARESFRFYREQGYPLQDHNYNDSEHTMDTSNSPLKSCTPAG